MRVLIWMILATSIGGSARAADIAALAGESLFNRNCSVCHSVVPGANRIGPSLHGIVGRPAGSLPGYSYSAAMRGIGKPWDPQALHAFLQNPRAFVPGTKMAFPGLHQPDAEDKLIAYLSNLE